MALIYLSGVGLINCHFRLAWFQLLSVTTVSRCEKYRCRHNKWVSCVPRCILCGMKCEFSVYGVKSSISVLFVKNYQGRRRSLIEFINYDRCPMDARATDLRIIRLIYRHRDRMCDFQERYGWFRWFCNGDACIIMRTETNVKWNERKKLYLGRRAR